MANWYKKQPITIKGAIIGGSFAILAAIFRNTIVLYERSGIL